MGADHIMPSIRRSVVDEDRFKVCADPSRQLRKAPPQVRPAVVIDDDHRDGRRI